MVAATFGPNCCCGGVDECPQACSFCTAGTPRFFELTVSGVVNDTCSSCGSFNGTFILECVGTPQCLWEYTFPVAPCGSTAKYSIGMSSVFGQLWINVRLFVDGVVKGVDHIIQTSDYDCMNIVGLSQNAGGYTGDVCDGSAATVTVSVA